MPSDTRYPASEEPDLYRNTNDGQTSIYGYILSFGGHLKEDNRCGQLRKHINWDMVRSISIIPAFCILMENNDDRGNIELGEVRELISEIGVYFNNENRIKSYSKNSRLFAENRFDRNHDYYLIENMLWQIMAYSAI